MGVLLWQAFTPKQETSLYGSDQGTGKKNRAEDFENRVVVGRHSVTVRLSSSDLQPPAARTYNWHYRQGGLTVRLTSAAPGQRRVICLLGVINDPC